MPIIDAHTHCGCRTKWYPIDEVLKHLREADADGAVIFAFPEDMYRRVDTLESRIAANEYVLRVAQEHEGIYPFYFVWNDYHIPETLDQYVGIKWHRHADEPRYDYEDPRCEAMLNRIRELGLPVLIEEEFAETVAFVDRMREVPIIIPHIGKLNGGYEKMDAFFDKPHVYFDTSCADLEAIRWVLDHVGPERVIFGSDVSGTREPFFNYPRVELAKLERLGLSDADRELILGGNILRLIGGRTLSREATSKHARSSVQEKPSESWYARSYRKLFFDFHSHSAAVGLAADFNAERWAERLVKANAQAVSVFVKGGQGWSFYRKGRVRYVHPQLPAGLDMLEEQLRALHRHGLRAIGYYHTFGSEPVARDHPDWVMRDAQGNPQGHSICMLGPLLEAHMLPHLREVLEHYELDALFFDGTYASRPCYCDACKERFQRDTGEAIPTESTDPRWDRYVRWCLEAFRQVRARISETVHAIRPDLPVSFNWVYSMRQPEIVPEHVGNLMIDVPPDDQAFQGSYHARYWATLGVPFDIMNSAFLQWWGDWGCKPAVALQQEVATAIANGGLTWIGYQMTHTFDVEPAVMEQMGAALAFVKQREHLLIGAQPIPNVAILNSTAGYFAGGQARFHTDQVALRGAHRLFLEAGIPHHFLHEQALLERLSDYRAVVLPDTRHIPDALAEVLEGYVRDGGVLLATYRAGTEDALGNVREGSVVADLLGVSLRGDLDHAEAYIEVTDAATKQGALDMPLLVHGRFACATPVASDVESLARLRKPYLRADGQFLLRSSPPGEDAGYPAITRRRVGKGTALYVAGQVFRGYQTHNQWCLKPILANLLTEAMGQPLVRLESPAWLEVALMRQGSRILVHLVNFHGNRPVDRNNVCVEQVLPVRDVTVYLTLPTDPARVRLEPEGVEPKWSYEGNVLCVQVPEVVIHTAVAVETAR